MPFELLPLTSASDESATIGIESLVKSLFAFQGMQGAQRGSDGGFEATPG